MLINAMDFLHYGLGRYDMQIIYSKVSENIWEAVEKQGGPINEVNRIREKCGLHKINQVSNFRTVKKAWKTPLLEGRGVVISIQSLSFRYKMNEEIKNVFEWFIQERPMFKIDSIETPKFDLFFIHLKKEKQESTTDEIPVQIPDSPL